MGLAAQKKIHAEKTNGNEVKTRRPEWLKVRFRSGDEFKEVNGLIKKYKLHTVCESAHCPNVGECWGNRTATFMILGDVCTRSCGFCAVKTGRPFEQDMDEPARVAEAVHKLGLKHVVITSVNRDELDDGGSRIWASTIRNVRKLNTGCRIEVLIPDFKGDKRALQNIYEAKPDILNHNIETVRRLYASVRPQADYQQSLDVIRFCNENGMITKSGIMIGIGETNEEIFEVMRDLRDFDCEIMTIGQYLQPSRNHLPVDRYVTPREFANFKETGLEMGFKYFESGPLVRSSYHAHKQVI